GTATVRRARPRSRVLVLPARRSAPGCRGRRRCPARTGRVGTRRDAGGPLQLHRLRLCHRDSPCLRQWPGLLPEQPRHSGGRRRLLQPGRLRRGMHRERRRLLRVVQLGRHLPWLLQRLLRPVRHLRHGQMHRPRLRLRLRHLSAVRLRSRLLLLLPRASRRPRGLPVRVL
ncbi:MAG: hypothetical protein AVDCRST_MAG59-2415, partial [uncultured Thermomicrobiales bacterium]